MKNTMIINELSRYLAKTSELIEEFTHGIASNEMEGKSDFVSLYSDMRLDELEHAQRLMLLMTDAIVQDTPENSPAENADEDEGSVFAEGDLDCNKNDEETEEAGEEK